MGSLAVLTALQHASRYLSSGNSAILDAVVPPLWLEDAFAEIPGHCSQLPRGADPAGGGTTATG